MGMGDFALTLPNLFISAHNKSIMSLLDGLNPEQRRAAEQVDGPVMILAGAGSGKTRTLTYRIAHLLQSGADPFRILALTFTNKAAREMQERITALVGPDARALWMGTFHSIFAKILRAEAPLIGYQKSFGIYDTDDCKSLVKKIVKDFNLDPKQYKESRVLYRISMAKNSLVSAEYYVENNAFHEEDVQMRLPELGRIFLEYSNRLKQASIMDFDDLLFNTNVLFRDFPETLLKYQKRFLYIMVDEYQDTNYAQYLIVKKLAAGHKNLCVVGDDSQSIYSFRGANIQNILNFQHDYPEARKFKLEQNYRSTGHIVDISNSIIEHNRDRIPKKIWTENEQGSKAKVLRSASDIEEGNCVAGEIFQTRMNCQAHPRDFAVLYRINSQSKAIEDALRKYNIPYRIYGGLSFYRRKEIKDVLSYFRWVVNPNDEEALLRCINNPARGIGETTLTRLRLIGALCGGGSWKGMEFLRSLQNPAAGGGNAAGKPFDGRPSAGELPNGVSSAGEPLGGAAAGGGTAVQNGAPSFPGEDFPGQEALKKQAAWLDNLGVPPQVYQSPEALAQFRLQVAASINSGTKARLFNLMDHIMSLNVRLSQTDAYDLAVQIWKASGLEAEYKAEETPESESRTNNVEELLNSVKTFCEEDPLMVDPETGEMVAMEGVVTLDRFLQDVALLTDQDEKDDATQDKVTLMTVHAAKGLEFPYVFVVGCEEELFPAAQSLNNREDVEEERRLFYVAVTRAEKGLWLSFANRRMRWGETLFTEPSRFLLELDASHLQNPELLQDNPFAGLGFDDDAENAWGPLSRRQSGFSGSVPGGSPAGRTAGGSPSGLPGRFPASNNPQGGSPGGSPGGGRDIPGRNRLFAGQTGQGPDRGPAASFPAPKPDLRSGRFKKLSQLQASAPPPASASGGTSADDAAALLPGKRVRHAKFGTGVVMKAEGEGANRKLLVRFDTPGVGEKTLLTKFAKLEALD